MPQQNHLHTEDLIQWLNKARQDPLSLIPFLETHLLNFRNELQLQYAPNCFYKTTQGKKAWYEAIEFLKLQNPLPSFKKNEALSKAAEEHAKDLCQNDTMGSIGSNGSTVSTRIKKYCEFEKGSVGQTVAQQFRRKIRNHARETVLSWIVSDGSLERADRNLIFNGSYNFFGVSIESNSYRYVTVITYSTQDLAEKRSLIVENIPRILETKNLKNLEYCDLNNTENNPKSLNIQQTKAYKIQLERGTHRTSCIE